MWATTPAADKALAAAFPQGAVATHRTTLRVARDKSVMALTLPGLFGGVAISRVLLASDRLSPTIRFASSGPAADAPASTTTVCRVGPSPDAPPAALHPATPRARARAAAVCEATRPATPTSTRPTCDLTSGCPSPHGWT